MPEPVRTMNPFTIGRWVPAERAVERRMVVRRAFDAFQKRGHVAVYGRAGTGRTTLLRYLASSAAWSRIGSGGSLERSHTVSADAETANGVF